MPRNAKNTSNYIVHQISTKQCLLAKEAGRPFDFCIRNTKCSHTRSHTREVTTTAQSTSWEHACGIAPSF